MKLILIALTMILSGCSTQQMMCVGTGTCYADGARSTNYAGASAGGSFSASTIQTPIGDYAVIPNYSTGRVQAIVPLSSGK